MLNLKDYIYDIPDFPTKGVLFRDITPLLAEPTAFQQVNEQLAQYCKSVGAQVILAPDSRGFIFGCPVADKLGIGFVPVRKKGKLPRTTVGCAYTLEYGTNELFIHADSLKPGQKVVIIDDVLATGGTVLASISLAEQLQAQVVGVATLIELEALKGREALKDYDLYSIIKY